MLKMLSELCLSRKFVSIYTNCEEPSKFYYGTILAVNDKEIAIDMTLPDGGNDGIVAEKVDKVFRIEIGGQYEKKMKKLCSLNPYKPFEGRLDNSNIMESILLLALRLKEIVSIELLDSGYDDIVGFVDVIENGQCKIRQIDEYGYEDGCSYILINDITKISYLSQYEKRILNLWNFNK